MPALTMKGSKLTRISKLLIKTHFALRSFLAASTILLLPSPAFAEKTALATGNGFGFGVYSSESDSLSGYYAHPYMFVKPDPSDSLSEGIPTTNFIKSMRWKSAPPNAPGSSAAKAPREASRTSAAKTPCEASRTSAAKAPHEASRTSDPNPSPGARASRPHARYLNESHIICKDDPLFTEYFYMPTSAQNNVLITSFISKNNGKRAPVWLEIEWRHPLLSIETQKVDQQEVQVLRFKDVSEILVMQPLKSKHFVSQSSTGTKFSGAQQWALYPVDTAEQIPDASRRVPRLHSVPEPERWLKDELADSEQWRVKPPLQFHSDDERKLWRQSETVLRMAQIKESNKSDRHNEGLILASLPDGAWFVPWVRDMAYATMAMSKMGHKREAQLALQAYFNARPVGKMKNETGGLPYQISVCRYFGDGSEEPFFTSEGSTNVELDDWGLVLWALGEHYQKYHDMSTLNYETENGTVFDSSIKLIIKPLLANLESYNDGLIVTKDTSIWEERQKDKKHFAFTTSAAINGLKAFDKILKDAGNESINGSQEQIKSTFNLAEIKNLREELKNKVELLQRGFAAAFVPHGELRGTVEAGIKNEVDGAALSAISSGIITNREEIKTAVERMQRLKMPSGGYRRVTCILTDPAIYEYWYERQEFLFIDFLMADAYLKLGMKTKADELLNRIVQKAALDNFFVPEMYVSEVNYRFKGPVGTATGAIPMVGYGAGVYILYRLELESTGR